MKVVWAHFFKASNKRFAVLLRHVKEFVCISSSASAGFMICGHLQSVDWRAKSKPRTYPHFHLLTSPPPKILINSYEGPLLAFCLRLLSTRIVEYAAAPTTVSKESIDLAEIIRDGLAGFLMVGFPYPSERNQQRHPLRNCAFIAVSEGTRKRGNVFVRVATDPAQVSWSVKSDESPWCLGQKSSRPMWCQGTCLRNRGWT